MIQFKLQRAGEFSVMTRGDNHCGTKPNLKVRYEVKCTCGENSLDSRGFLFDQMKIDKFFQEQRVTELSCEQFCMQVSRKLYKQIKSENGACDILKFEATLSPEPFAASITFEYAK